MSARVARNVMLHVSLVLVLVMTLAIDHAHAQSTEEAGVQQDVQRGIEAAMAGQTDAARAALEAAHVAEPQNVQILQLLGRLSLGRLSVEESEPVSLDEAERYLTQALAFDHDNAQTLSDLALLHVLRGAYAQAEAIYLQLAERPDLPEGLVAGHLGELYLLWGKLDVAEAQLNAAIKHQAFPQHTVAAFRHLGQLYEQTDRQQEARELYEQALDFVQRVPNEAAALTEEFKAKRANQPPHEVAP